jgi:hypothetical protein
VLSGQYCCALRREERCRRDTASHDIYAKRFRQLEIAVELSYINAEPDEVLRHIVVQPRAIEFLR